MNSGKLKYDLYFELSGEEDRIILKSTTFDFWSSKVTCKYKIRNAEEQEKSFIIGNS